MTSRHIHLSKSIFVGGQCLLLAGVAHAQDAARVSPTLSPARTVASHIAPAKRKDVQAQNPRELLFAVPGEKGENAPIQIAAAPLPQAVQTFPNGAKSVITAPRETNRRLALPYNPAASKPTAVPFVASPESEPVYPTTGPLKAPRSVQPSASMVAKSPVVTSPAQKVEPSTAEKPSTVRLALRPVKQPASKAQTVPAPKEAKDKAQEDRVLLARLESDLNEASRRLDRARGRISEGQRQLAQFADVLQEAIIEAGPDARGLSPFVKVAQRYRGTPYVWGGVSARGFDCSGFIIRVMQDLGYRALPHSAAEQFRYGAPVAEKLLKPGDLVFFANTYKPGISHVGIYLGRRRFIHAANSQVGTIVSSLDESKWSAKYAGGRRLMPVRR